MPVQPQTIKSMAPGKFEWNFRHVIFKQILVIDGWGISYEIALLWMLLDFIDSGNGLGAVRQQAIIWANVDPDLCRHMVLKSIMICSQLGFEEQTSVNFKSEHRICIWNHNFAFETYRHFHRYSSVFIY